MTGKDIALRFAAAAAMFHIAILFASPSLYGMLFAASVGAAVLLLDFRNGLLVVVACALSVGALEAFVRLNGGSLITAYYRPHEMLADKVHYRPNGHIAMTEQHGDLLAIDPKLDRALAQPRKTAFDTDSRGFRNDTDAREVSRAIIGDSYVVGIGNTQADTITAQLSSGHGIDAYNMGYPAGPLQYADNVAAARAEWGEDVCAVVMMFEGNDFQLIDRSEVAARGAMAGGTFDVLKAYVGALRSNSELSKLFFGLYSQGLERLRRMRAERAGIQENVTLVRPVAGEPMVFLKGYAEVVQREHYDDHGFIRAQFQRATPDLIVFVPDKFRVYGRLLDEGRVAKLPHAQFEHLQRIAEELRVPLLDLTPALTEASRQLLEQGVVTYWRDDTHWNRLGIGVAAQELARSLAAHSKASCHAVSGMRAVSVSHE